jgi:hypothetical protein
MPAREDSICLKGHKGRFCQFTGNWIFIKQFEVNRDNLISFWSLKHHFSYQHMKGSGTFPPWITSAMSFVPAQKDMPKSFNLFARWQHGFNFRFQHFRCSGGKIQKCLTQKGRRKSSNSDLNRTSVAPDAVACACAAANCWCMLFAS